MTEEQYVSYFESLAVASLEINHNQNGIKSFAYVDDADNLEEFDEHLKSTKSSVFMLLVADDGSFSDNNSENHVQDVEGMLYVLFRVGNNFTKSQARNASLPMLINILGRVKQDARNHQLIPGSKVNFRIDDIPYIKIGPAAEEWYGYAVGFRFGCPFGYVVNSAIWRDR